MHDLRLAAGNWSATVRPEVGGALSSLRLGEVDILRSMDAEADHPLHASCFPLVPYCNRIANGRFDWDGKAIQLMPNLPPHPHPLHGLGWLRPWRVVRQDGSSALLEDTYEGEAEWPWAYRAHQHVALDETGCTVRLLVENRAPQPAPLGLGLHPYFRRSSNSRVRFEADAMLGIDDEFLPDGQVHAADHLADWKSGASLPDELVDHCFSGWIGRAEIEDEQGRISIAGFGAPHCHVFAPPSGEELCIEPVNHMPDALNRDPAAMPVVAPGCATGVAMRIEATAPLR